jgi:hypothetical protein
LVGAKILYRFDSFGIGAGGIWMLRGSGRSWKMVGSASVVPLEDWEQVDASSTVIIGLVDVGSGRRRGTAEGVST